MVHHIEVILSPDTKSILAGGYTPFNGLLKSEDQGITWNLLRDGMELDLTTRSANITALAVDVLNPSHFYLSRRSGDSRGVYASQDEGNSWYLSLQGKLAYGLAGRGGLVFASTFDEGLWVSTDSGKTWENRAPSLTVSRNITFDPQDHTRVYFSTAGEGILLSSDSGSTFVQWGLPGKDIVDIGIKLSGDKLITFAATARDSVFRSLDSGASWEAVNNGLPGPWPDVLIYSIEIDPFDPKIVYVGNSEGVYKTIDSGLSWQAVNTGLGVISIFHSTNSVTPTVLKLAADPENEGVLYAGTGGWGLFKTDNAGENWQLIGPNAGSVRDIDVSPLNPGLVFAGSGHGLFIRKEKTWKPSSLYWDGFETSGVSALATSPVDSNIVVAAMTNGIGDLIIYVSRDGGINWEWDFIGVGDGTVVRAIKFDPLNPGRIYATWWWPAGGNPGGIVISSDTGRTWITENLDFRAIDIAIHPVNSDILYLLGVAGEILKSEDMGETWTSFRESTPYQHDAILIDPNDSDVIYLATKGVYKSRDTGVSWEATSFEEWTTDLAFDHLTGALLASTFGDGVHFTYDGGETWNQVPGSHCFPYVNSIAVSSDGKKSVLYAGTFGSGLFEEEVLIITDVAPSGETTGLPEKMDLLQNYPNPFNPETRIDFALPEAGLTRLIIYDLLGREVVRLIDGELSAGYHERKWDASESASGIYFYRLTSGDFVQTRKMLLLK
ncbi:MAG: T9SS type A sorting domain-containing protein [Candidatus Marinimicrobia bacterium]|nr:T9SS type A sorting domain-containing protein [Candidatus Neomarinimicrobiota bacterium]